MTIQTRLYQPLRDCNTIYFDASPFPFFFFLSSGLENGVFCLIKLVVGGDLSMMSKITIFLDTWIHLKIIVLGCSFMGIR